MNSFKKWKFKFFFKFNGYKFCTDCDEKKQCEHEDSKCVDTVTKTNICIWLKTLQEDDDVTVPITSTSSGNTMQISYKFLKFFNWKKNWNSAMFGGLNKSRQVERGQMKSHNIQIISHEIFFTLFKILEIKITR